MAKKVAKKVEVKAIEAKTEVVHTSGPSNAEAITGMKEQYKAMAKDMPHREYGLALKEVVAKLELVADSLKLIANIEADLKKKSVKNNKGQE